MKKRQKLKINWIMPRTNLSGGIKSNRLIAEAMIRLGHEINIAYVDLPKPWPKVLPLRPFFRHINQEFRIRGKRSHHLESSTANLIPVSERIIRPEHVPDADVTIATWWETREWIENWPISKGVKAYFIRHHELHGKNCERVSATYRMPGLKFVIAKWLKRVMLEQYNDPNAVLVPNGVDWVQFDSKPRGKSSKPTIGMLYGRQEWKGAKTAFQALRLIRERYPNLRAISFGSFPILKKHNPPEWLEFYHKPDQNKIPLLYQQADCWIVPSTTEGFGMPGLEAAASHCPIVSTRCGGPEDYVVDGMTGFLVPVGDSIAMAKTVQQVLELPDDEWRTISQASYELSKRFDWDISAKILEQAILEAFEEQQCSGSIMQCETA